MCFLTKNLLRLMTENAALPTTIAICSTTMWKKLEDKLRILSVKSCFFSLDHC